MKEYKEIIDYIEYLKRTYNLMISIKDYKGFVYDREKMEFALRPYLAHTSPYCMFVKESEENYIKCINYNKELVNKSRDRDYFFSICHAGLCELIIPIKDEKTIYGSINISHFNFNREKSLKAIKTTFTNNREEEAERIFKIFVRPTFVDSSTLIPSLKLLSSFLLNIIKTSPSKEDKKEIDKETILSNYIKDNIDTKIIADDIMKELNLSRLQLKQIIKNNNKNNLRDYVNTIRIEKSEKLLLETTKTPKEIAISLGFKSYRHFEIMFKDKLNIFPSDYRKYYKNEKHY